MKSEKLNVQKICIIGCGTYGAYLTKRLLETFANAVQITIIEIGDDKIKSEKEIGLVSESQTATAAEQGRYFGLGGTSARWGGQILFFDDRDNPENNSDWQYIIDTNKKYRRVVIQNLLSKDPKIDRILEDKTDVKTGIWLKYSKRNTFKLLDKSDLNTVSIIKNQRVIDFIFEDKKINAVVCQDTEGVTQTHEADIFYLTAGAIESCRLLLNLNERYNIFPNNDLGKHYGDHLSVELFKVTHCLPVVEGTNYLPIFFKGSLITKRLMVFEGINRVGFVHLVFNKDIRVFTAIKQLLFGKQKLNFNLKDLLIGLEFLVRFGFSVLFLKKMYAHRNNWSVHLDIEQSAVNTNAITLSEETDAYNQKAVKLNWAVSDEDKTVIEKIKNDLEKRLEKEGIPFSIVYDNQIGASKIEDVYHPVGFMRLGKDEKSVLDYNCCVRGIENLFHFSTAMFPSAKSINPTGAAFCFIEQHLTTLMKETSL